ncbi:MAG: putative serine/threonine protein kinase [Betaproteobacteria bacterium]|nr:putative serine/threonine protein kinase [Betaproteobacteria bacterium]
MSQFASDAPQSLGKYKITGILGRGAMGVVYKGWDPGIARHVALKAIRKDLMDQEGAEQAVARFRNEAMAAGRLNHPSIVAVYDYGEDGPTAFIAMEYAEGQGLREYLRARGAIKLSDIAEMMGQLLGALDYAHQRGVVHRDIKPANIIITVDNKLKVTDFGIARLDTTSLTQTGMIVGTPSYMAPEQYTGVGVDNRADLFSSGVMLYEMITGVKPFSGTNEVIAYQICHAPHVVPSQLDPTLPAALDEVINRALAKKKEERYATAAEFLRGLNAAISGDDEATVVATAARQAPLIGETTSMPRGWSPDALHALEEALTIHIGPVARTIVKRAAAKSLDAAALIEILVNTLDGFEERQQFGRRARLILDQTQPESASNTADAATIMAARGLPQADLDLAAARLTPYLGPIAKVLVKKTGAKVRDLAGLYAELAGHLTDEHEKASFLKEAGLKK